MSHLLVMPKNLDLKYIDKIDGLVVGLKDYSVHTNLELSLEEITSLRKKYLDKELFVVMNKNMTNEDIPSLERILTQLSSLDVTGVFFYDLSILSIKKRLGLSLDLVWNQTHMVTNYNTCNYYYNEGVKYATLSLEITVEEMCDIHKNSKIMPMVYVFGRNIVAHSKRHLLSNYFKHFHLPQEKNEYVITETVTDRKYFVKEEKLGTTIVNNELLNGIRALYDLKSCGIEYFILDEVVDDDLFVKVIDCYLQALDDKSGENKEKNVQFLEKLIDSNYEGFFYKKTIYKVKKNG